MRGAVDRRAGFDFGSVRHFDQPEGGLRGDRDGGRLGEGGTAAGLLDGELPHPHVGRIGHVHAVNVGAGARRPARSLWPAGPDDGEVALGTVDADGCGPGLGLQHHPDTVINLKLDKAGVVYGRGLHAVANVLGALVCQYRIGARALKLEADYRHRAECRSNRVNVQRDDQLIKARSLNHNPVGRVRSAGILHDEHAFVDRRRTVALQDVRHR